MGQYNFRTYINIDTTGEPTFKHLAVIRENGSTDDLHLTKVLLFGSSCYNETPSISAAGLIDGALYYA